MAAKKLNSDPLVRYTICAACDNMWDGFGLPCGESTPDKSSCIGYVKQTEEGEKLALEFQDETFVAKINEHGPELFTFMKLRPLQAGMQLNIDFDI